MDKMKVLELAREAEILRQLSMEVPFVIDRLERFAALIEAEVRGDAEPVAWCWVSNGRPEEKPFYGKGPDQDIIERAAAAEIPRTVQYFYTHPTPAVVRQLVEALESLLNDVGRANSMQGAVKARAALSAARKAGL